MIQIRKNVFETNSSSTHSLVITTEEEFEKFKNNELVYCEWKTGPFEQGKMYPKTEVDAYADAVGENFEDYNFYTASHIFENEYLESFEKKFITPSGDKMVAFGNFGYDG